MKEIFTVIVSVWIAFVLAMIGSSGVLPDNRQENLGQTETFIYCSGETAPDWHSDIELHAQVKGVVVSGTISVTGQTNSDRDKRIPLSGTLFRLGPYLNLDVTWEQPELGYHPTRNLRVSGLMGDMDGSIVYRPVPTSVDNLAKNPLQEVETFSCIVYEV